MKFSQETNKKYKTDYATIKEGNIVKMKHRVILEKHLGRKINGIVHHKDGNKRNNDIKNLIEMGIREHISLHHAGKKNPKPVGWEPHNKISKVKKEKIIKFKKDNLSFYNYEIAKRFMVSPTTVGIILKDAELNNEYISNADLNKIKRIRRLT